MKKIILFTDSLVRGGAQRQLVELATNLDRKKFNVLILIYHDIQQLRDCVDLAGIPVVLIEKRGKFDLVFYWRLTQFFRKQRPDIVQSFLNTANFWARIAGVLAGVKRIITSERNIDIRHSRKRMFFERFLHHTSNAIVVNAEAIMDILTHDIKIPSGKIRIIYNGVNGERFKNPPTAAVTTFCARYNLSKYNFVLVLPGRLVPQKNHQCLIRAVKAAEEKSASWKVLFVGNEIDLLLKQKLQKQISDLGLVDHFIFAGRQDDMGVIYSVADVVVLPSLWEGFPNVVLEAMAVGKVVVASDIADNARIITNGINGYLFKSNQHSELASLLVNLDIIGEDKRIEMGQKGLKMVEEEYSIKKMVSTYEELYLS